MIFKLSVLEYRLWRGVKFKSDYLLWRSKLELVFKMVIIDFKFWFLMLVFILKIVVEIGIGYCI